MHAILSVLFSRFPADFANVLGVGPIFSVKYATTATVRTARIRIHVQSSRRRTGVRITAILMQNGTVLVLTKLPSGELLSLPFASQIVYFQEASRMRGRLGAGWPAHRLVEAGGG